MSNVPLLIPPTRADEFKNVTSRLVFTYNRGVVAPGQTWTAREGKRFILSAFSYGVLFLQMETGKIYFQNALGFETDVTAMPDNLDPLRYAVHLTEVEFEFFIGVCAGCSGSFIAIAVGIHVAEEMVIKRKKLGRYMKQFLAIARASGTLQLIAPHLHDRLVIQFAKTVFGSLWSSTKPGDIARYVGCLVGAFGEEILEQKVSLYSAVYIIFENFLIRTLVVLPGAVKQGLDINLDTLDEQTLRRKLSEHDIALSERDWQGIKKALREKPKELKAVFDELVEAFGPVR
jgi:hypothetical protein